MPRGAMASPQDEYPQSAEHPYPRESGTASHTVTIGERFIADLTDYYVTMAEKLESIAEYLELSKFVSRLIEERTATQKLHLVMQKWLNGSHGLKTLKEMWKKLIEMLNSRAVDLKLLAKTIEEELPLGLPKSPTEVFEGDSRFLRRSSPRPCSAPSQLQSPHGSPYWLRSQLRSYMAGSSLDLELREGTSHSRLLTKETNYRFAIMVANDNEMHATMFFLGSSRKRWSKVKEDVEGYTYEGDDKLRNKIEIGQKNFLTYVPIRVGKVPGLVVRCAAMGSFRPSGSHGTTLQLIKNASDERWDLEMIFIVGCCGTCPEMPAEIKEEVDSKKLVSIPAKRTKGFQPKTKKQTLTKVSNPAAPHDKLYDEIVPIGTVLFASMIFQYAMGKLNDDIPELIPMIISSVSVDLTSVQYGDEGSDTSRIVKKVESASFLSGDFVVKGGNTALRLARIATNQKYVGFEMEGIGAVTATENARILLPDLKIPKVALVKGVSDKAGGKKNDPCAIQFFPEEPLPDVGEDSRQQMCTISSLTLVLRYIIQVKADSWYTSK